MGCSASRSHEFIHHRNPSNSGSSRPQSPYSFSDSGSTPVSRTFSLPTPLVHHPPLRRGDTNHLVSLTSTTYGSLVLIDGPRAPNPNPKFSGPEGGNRNAQMGKPENGTDPLRHLSLDSVINTWELMEGLDDEFGFHVVESPKKPSVKSLEIEEEFDVKSYEFVEHSDSKPLWKHLSEESLLAKMDPNVALSYRKALSAKQSGCREGIDMPQPKTPKSEVFNENDKSLLSLVLPDNDVRLKGGEERIVLYYTSLRGIRKTYEDCCNARVIFKGYRVCVDERDISMDSSYRKELQGVLGERGVSLPQVFIKGRYIGGVEEIKQLNESGELANLLEGFPVKHHGLACESCGDARFLPCPNCYGSRKVFEDDEGKLRRCPDCNENGLIRCPSCYP
ncbi:PREDICTED: uncharacterized protein At3g28850 [Ipomoea nil]|uniref:uncharacterized protein At3g28850 n=1 Tax=Ipomoea nil TaxID=35883 RepID=UPI00090147A6|nr:PREDICTED: uncharacterized protein At3g28850 [Ipomoea nil]